jgi:hypothetical protein
MTVARRGMQFFLPHTADEALALETFESIRKYAEETTGWTVSSRKIFSLRYHHESTDHYAEVGKNDPSSGEEIIAILHSNTFLICTRNRGVLRGLPIQVGENEVYEATDFE